MTMMHLQPLLRREFFFFGLCLLFTTIFFFYVKRDRLVKDVALCCCWMDMLCNVSYAMLAVLLISFLFGLKCPKCDRIGEASLSRRNTICTFYGISSIKILFFIFVNWG